jgi:hypothetical protein
MQDEVNTNFFWYIDNLLVKWSIKLTKVASGNPNIGRAAEWM